MKFLLTDCWFNAEKYLDLSSLCGPNSQRVEPNIFPHCGGGHIFCSILSKKIRCLLKTFPYLKKKFSKGNCSGLIQFTQSFVNDGLEASLGILCMAGVIFPLHESFYIRKRKEHITMGYPCVSKRGNTIETIYGYNLLTFNSYPCSVCHECYHETSDLEDEFYPSLEFMRSEL